MFKFQGDLEKQEKNEVDEEEAVLQKLNASFDENLHFFIQEEIGKAQEVCQPDIVYLEKIITHEKSSWRGTVMSWMVLTHTSLYLLIYYGNSPTSGSYSEALNLPETLIGVLKAATPLAAFLSTFMYNAIISKKFVYSYIISWTSLIIGAMLYYEALTFDSVLMIVAGRLLIGWGGGRVITRTYFATEVGLDERVLWSSLLVACNAGCITISPGISSLLEYIKSFEILGMKTTEFNIFSEACFFLFVTVCAIFFLLFKDKEPQNDIIVPFPRDPRASKVEDQQMPRKLLLDCSFNYSEISPNLETIPNEMVQEEIKQTEKNSVLEGTSYIKEYFPVYFIAIFFTFNKSVQEALITEISQTMKAHYDWDSQNIGFVMLSYTPVGTELL